MLPCIGFMDTRKCAGVSGSEVKSVLYGVLCNLSGVAFEDEEVADMLDRIGY